MPVIKLLDIKRGPGNAKYIADVSIDGRVYKGVKFGHKSYEQYKDSTPLKLYSSMDHGDENRRRLFHIRHKKNNGPAGLLSKRFLW